MAITIQHIAVRTESLQAEASWDDRDANGNILRHATKQFTLTAATRDALLAEATAAVTEAIIAVQPENLSALFKAVDDAHAQLAAKTAELDALDAAVAAKVTP